MAVLLPSPGWQECVRAICLCNDTSVGVQAQVPQKGEITLYTCDVVVERTVRTLDSGHTWASATRTVRYQGYENADLNNTNRAYVELSENQTLYSQSASYFEDWQNLTQSALAAMEQPSA